mgnify:CR=1 FL=1
MHSLYLIAAISLDPATAGKILGEIGVVYGLLQIVKKNVPSLTGKWAVVLNYAMSLIGAALIIPPNSFFSVGTLQVLLLAVIQANGSAGIHGTVQNVAPVALQTVLGQGPKVDAPQVDSVSATAISAQSTAKKYDLS